MNNCGWQNEEDYGSKYDYGIATKTSIKLPHNKDPENEMWVYDKHGDSGILSRFIKDDLRRFSVGKSSLKLGMSRGCAGIITAIIMLKPETLRIFGMHQVVTGEFQADCYSPEYLAVLTDPNRGPGPRRKIHVPRVPSESHDWIAENKTMLLAAEEMQCRLEW